MRLIPCPDCKKTLMWIASIPLGLWGWRQCFYCEDCEKSHEIDEPVTLG